MQAVAMMVRVLQTHLHRQLGGYVFQCHVYDINGVQDWATSEYETDVIVVMANVTQLNKLCNGIVDNGVHDKYMMAYDAAMGTNKNVNVFKLMKKCYTLSRAAIFVNATHFFAKLITE
jgi:hypothetical protein